MENKTKPLNVSKIKPEGYDTVWIRTVGTNSKRKDTSSCSSDQLIDTLKLR